MPRSVASFKFPNSTLPHMRHPASICFVYLRMLRGSHRLFCSMRVLSAVIMTLLMGAPLQAGEGYLPTPPSGHGLLPSFPPKRMATSRVRRARNTYGSHYFLGFTAIPLKKGDGFYKNTMVSLNTVAYGLTEHLSTAGSLDLVSLIRARSGGPVYSGRLQLSGSVSELVHIGVAASYLNVRVPIGAEVPKGEEVPPGFLAGMGVVTIGSINNQITVAGGWSHDGKQASRGPLFNVGGAVRIFPNVMLVTEHWIFSDPDRSFAAHSFGTRILGDDLAIDIGFTYDKEYTKKITPIGLPFLSATLNF